MTAEGAAVGLDLVRPWALATGLIQSDEVLAYGSKSPANRLWESLARGHAGIMRCRTVVALRVTMLLHFDSGRVTATHGDMRPRVPSPHPPHPHIPLPVIPRSPCLPPVEPDRVSHGSPKRTWQE